MNKEELLWLRRYNQYCGKFMYKERCRRGISEQKISRGVCTRTELRLMENGETPWKKMIGDYLLQRLGVPTEYFEVMADARELNFLELNSNYMQAMKKKRFHMEWKHLSYSDTSTHSDMLFFVLEELLNVLECISVKGKEDQKYKEEETEVTEFLKIFEELYRLFSHPKKRMWQSISVSNTHEIGLTLKMLRKAMGLSAAKVSAANPDHLTARQIEKIEAGTHRPSGRNYEMLMQFYHKTGLEGQLLQKSGGKAHGFNRGMKAKKLFAIIGQ